MSNQIKTPEKIEFDKLDFLRVEPGKFFNPDDLENVDAVILEYHDHNEVLDLINKIHSHNEKSVYTTPVFLLNQGGNMEDSVVALADGVITNISNLDSAAAVTRKIISRM